MAQTTFYSPFATHLALGDIDWVADTVKLLVATSAYVPDLDTHEFRSDVTNELAATGNYTAGGVALTSKSLDYDAASNTLRFLAANVAFPTLTPSSAFRYGVGYKSRGGLASADELIFLVNLVDDKDSEGSDFVVTWPSSGVGYIFITAP